MLGARNDGYCLVQGTEDSYTVHDCVGDWLEDPGSGWDVCGAGATQDSTIVRSCDVTVGNGDRGWSASTAASTCEWTVEDADFWSSGGFHGLCGGTHLNRMQSLRSACESQSDEAACAGVARDTSLEAPETMYIPTCEWVQERISPPGGGRPQTVASCGVSPALLTIERCEIMTSAENCNRLARNGWCVWEPSPNDDSSGICSVPPLHIAAYLPYSCSKWSCLRSVWLRCKSKQE